MRLSINPPISAKIIMRPKLGGGMGVVVEGGESGLVDGLAIGGAEVGKEGKFSSGCVPEKSNFFSTARLWVLSATVKVISLSKTSSNAASCPKSELIVVAVT